MYDPLPPLDSINIYKRPVLNAPSRLLADASPLSMFFQSLLPSFNVQGGNFVAPEVVAAAEAAAVALDGNEGAVGIGNNQQRNLDLLNNPFQIVEAGNLIHF